MKKKMKCITAFILACVLCFGILGSNNTAEAATKNVINQNVSYSAVSCNASDGSIPAGITTVYTGESIYFNLQVSSDLYIKKTILYVQAPGESSYSKVYTDTANNYMRYTYYNYTVPSTTGTLKYYFKITWCNKNGKTTSTSSTSKKSITVKKASTSITTNYTKTSSTSCSTTSTSYNVKVVGKKTSGTTIKAGNTFYTYTDSKGSNKTTQGSVKGKKAYYVKAGSSYIDVGAAQCLAFARYIQYLMYGKSEYSSSSSFTKIAKSKSANEDNAKTYITKAGSGAHIRAVKTSGNNHSLVVVKVTSKGFFYVDANGTSNNNDGKIQIGYMSWSGFASKYKTITYISYYTG